MKRYKPTSGSRTGGRPRRRLRLVVNAGPTREFFDSVRFISNPSSGKMGYAIAEAAAAAGHSVTLVTGPVALKPPKGVRVVRVVTAAEMAAATKKAFARADAAILTAAVCDYRPMRPAGRKLAKKNKPRKIVLVPTEDIAAALGGIKGERVVIGFAMEDHDGRRHAEQKLRRKNLDAIILNGPENVGADRAAVEFLKARGRWQRWPATSKRRVAGRLIKALQELTAFTLSG